MNAGIIQDGYVNTPAKILLGPIIVHVLLAFAWLMMGSIVKVSIYNFSQRQKGQSNPCGMDGSLFGGKVRPQSNPEIGAFTCG